MLVGFYQNKTSEGIEAGEPFQFLGVRAKVNLAFKKRFRQSEVMLGKVIITKVSQQVQFLCLLNKYYFCKGA